jgi:hypothetical protein
LIEHGFEVFVFSLEITQAVQQDSFANRYRIVRLRELATEGFVLA